MAREIKNDYDRILSFIKEYELKQLLSNADYKSSISKFHKKYFSYLTLIAELNSLVKSKLYITNITESQNIYFKESCSDIGTSFFLLFHGSYKGSKMLLRSSIETFLKAFCSDFIVGILNEKSMFEFFNKIKNTPFFKKRTNKKLLNELHSIYKSLCRDVHTAEESNMSNVSAMESFPIYSKTEAKFVCDFALKLVTIYVTLICIKYNDFYHQIYYKNKDIIKHSFDRTAKPIIYNLD